MAGFASKGCDEFQFCMIRKGLHCWSGDQQWQKKTAHCEAGCVQKQAVVVNEAVWAAVRHRGKCLSWRLSNTQ